MEYTHKPVLLHECLDGLNIRPDGIYVDGTLGRAGHSREIAARLTTGRLICIDRDQAALDAAPAHLEGLMDKVTLVHGNFSEVASVLRKLNIDGVDGMLFDFVKYDGFSGEDLNDTVIFDKKSGRINRILVNGSKSGIQTTLWRYYDRYNNRNN